MVNCTKSEKGEDGALGEYGVCGYKNYGLEMEVFDRLINPTTTSKTMGGTSSGTAKGSKDQQKRKKRLPASKSQKWKKREME